MQSVLQVLATGCNEIASSVGRVPCTAQSWQRFSAVGTGSAPKQERVRHSPALQLKLPPIALYCSITARSILVTTALVPHLKTSFPFLLSPAVEVCLSPPLKEGDVQKGEEHLVSDRPAGTSGTARVLCSRSSAEGMLSDTE